MSTGWTRPNEQAKQEEPAKVDNLAYINKETREAMKTDPEIELWANAMLDKGTELMDKLDKAGLTTESKTRDGKSTYTNKMEINVEPAYNKEGGNLTYKDGSNVYNATMTLKDSKGQKAIFYGGKDENGDVAITNVGVSRWNNYEKKGEYIKADGIADHKYVTEAIKATVALAKDEGILIERNNARGSSLGDFSVEANKFFSANSEKVPNKEGELVNNAFAKYEKDNYGEKVTLHAHMLPDRETGELTQPSNVVVELGNLSDGKPYARAINYDINKNFEERQQGEAPATAYINNVDDIVKYIDLPEIQEAVANFKGFNEPEQTKEQPKEDKGNKKKETVERD